MKVVFTLLTIFSILPSVHSFAPSAFPAVVSSRASVAKIKKTVTSTASPFHPSIKIPRGGANNFPSPTSSLSQSSTSLSSVTYAMSEAIGAVLTLVSSNLQSGPFGVVALWGVTFSVVLPLTLYKKIYGIGVAYGFSVCAAGYAMLKILNPASSGSAAATLLSQVCMFYGFRLGSYLIARDLIRNEESKVKNGTIMSRVIFSISLSLFYALLVTPTLYACRNAPSSANLALAGASIAWFGAILEAIADYHKLLRKSSTKKMEKKDDSDEKGDTFVGPTTWTYHICRHPNYLGEILMWVGLYVGGIPSFGTSAIAWLCSTLGMFGIVSIMAKATQGLEKRQSEKYSGQQLYDTYKQQVTSPLFPFVK